MRTEIGVLLMEETDGSVAVQLFAETTVAERVFGNLKGHPGDPRRRATLLTLKYGEDGKVEVGSQARMTPVIETTESRPDGYVIGEGPVNFPKE
jgi:hypothetical protein